MQTVFVQPFKSMRVITTSIMPAFAFLSFVVAAAAQETPQSKLSPQEQISKNCLAIRDLSHLPLEEISRSRTVTWVVGNVAQIGPPETGFVLRDDGYGKFTKILTSTKYELFYKGNLSVLSVLTDFSTVPSQEPYRFGYRSTFANSRNPLAYSPFLIGGTAVFQFHTERQENERYSQIYVIPDAAASYIAAAITYYKNAPLLHDSYYKDRKMSAREANKLITYLANDNPIVASVACRLLSRADRLPMTWLLPNPTSTISPDPWRQSLLVDTVLESCAKEKRAAYIQYITDTVRSSNTPEQAIALLRGVHAAMRGSAESKNVLMQVNSRIYRIQPQDSINRNDAVSNQPEGKSNDELNTFLQLYDVTLPEDRR